jgi:hypothetical protein
MDETVVCAFCRERLPVEAADTHDCDPEGALVVYVRNVRASLSKVNRQPDGGLVIERLSPQPPEEMLKRAVIEAGGALNISGIYPVNEELSQWAEGVRMG